MHWGKFLGGIRLTAHLVSCQTIQSHGKKNTAGHYCCPQKETGKPFPPALWLHLFSLIFLLPQSVPKFHCKQYQQKQYHRRLDIAAKPSGKTDHEPDHILIFLGQIQVQPEAENREQNTIGIRVGNTDPGGQPCQHDIYHPGKQRQPVFPGHFPYTVCHKKSSQID